MKAMVLYWLSILLALPINLVETLVCNCAKNKCQFDGSCQPGFKCEEKFFGYFCEYNNLNRNDRESKSQLDDDDYTTCADVGDEFGTDYIKNRIYMIRMIVKDSSQFKNISVVFKDWSRERACNGHVVMPEATIVEYYCSTLETSNGLTIRGLAGKEICHVHITNGRNMAVGGSILTSAAPDDNTVYSKDGLIDGNRLPDVHSCFLTKRIENEFKIDVYLRMPSLVNYVEIVDSYKLLQPIAGTKVEFINFVNVVTRSVLLLIKPWRAHYTMQLNAVWRVSLFKAGQFGACEVEVRGDCGNGTYGHDCKSKCKSRCKDSRCTSKGLCIACRADLVAPKCCKRFCNPNRDCGDDGNCKHGCVKRKYGLDCSKDCSANCAGDGACDLSGSCLGGCKDGFHGRACVIRCSVNCAGKKNCHINGTCVDGCLPKFFGYNCFRKCNPPNYGLFCNQSCPRSCPKRECDYSGNCLSDSSRSLNQNGLDYEYIGVGESRSFADRLPSITFIHTITLLLVVLLSFV